MTWVFATGRCPASAAGVAQIEGFDKRPGIYSNGAVVLGVGGEELYALDLPAPALELAISISRRQEGTTSVLFNDRSTFYYIRQGTEVPTEGELPDYALHLHRVYHDPCPVAVDRRLPEGASIQLIHIVGDPEVLDCVQVECEIALTGVASVARNLPTDLVLTHLEAHKGFAVKKLCTALRPVWSSGDDQVDEEGVVLCMGDSGNDCTMLRSCSGIGVAMANAREETLDAEEFCTQATNGDDVCPGVLEVIELVCQAKKVQSNAAESSGNINISSMPESAGKMEHRWTMDSPAVLAASLADARQKGNDHVAVVCPDTATFRKHASHVRPEDLVVELGCSFGRCTALLAKQLSDPAKQLIGVDTSREVLAAASVEYPNLKFKRADVLRDPMGTLNMVRALCDANEGGNLCVFVDIGGNRELEALVALLPWIATALPRIPRLIVVKSETLSAAVAERGGVFDWSWLQSKSKSAVLARRGVGVGSGGAGGTVGEKSKSVLRRMPHPLKAPLRKNPDGVPICRFHNYNPREKGCKMHRDREGHGTSCPYDHEHCHWCGMKGHIALDCESVAPLI